MTRQLRRLRPYFRYLRQQSRTVAAAVVYGILFGASSGLGIPLLTDKVFPLVFDREGGALPLDTVILIALAIPLLFLLRATTGYLNGYYTQLTGVRILEQLRLDYFIKLQRVPLSFVQNRQTGDLISRGLADTAQLQHSLTLLANDGLKQPMTLLAALTFLVSKAIATNGVGLMLLGLASIPLVVFPIRFVGRKVIKRAQIKPD